MLPNFSNWKPPNKVNQVGQLTWKSLTLSLHPHVWSIPSPCPTVKTTNSGNYTTWTLVRLWKWIVQTIQVLGFILLWQSDNIGLRTKKIKSSTRLGIERCSYNGGGGTLVTTVHVSFSTVKPVLIPEWKHVIGQTANRPQVYLNLSVHYMLRFQRVSRSLGEKSLQEFASFHASKANCRYI